MMRWVVALLASAVFAQTPEPSKIVRQGGTLRLTAPSSAASARLNDRTVRLFRQSDGRAAGLMPIPAAEKPGNYTLELLDAAGTVVEASTVRVLDAHFRKQNVTIAPTLAELKPSPAETEAVTAFRNTVSEARSWSEPVELPVRGCMTSPFAVQCYLNGKPTGSIHAGIDQRSPAG